MNEQKENPPEPTPELPGKEPEVLPEPEPYQAPEPEAEPEPEAAGDDQAQSA